MLKLPHKIIVALLVPVFVFTTIVGSLSPITPAKAVIPVTVDADLPRSTASILDQIWEGLKTAVLGATARVVAYGLRKVAYDSAVWLASGGKGQTPFAHTKDFGSYLSAVGDQAFGQAIEELGKSTGLGNLCKLPDIKLDLAMKVGLRTDFLGSSSDPTVKPNCSFQTFAKNWFSGDSWKSQYGGNQIVGDFNKALQFDNNDLGIRLEAKEKIGQKVSKQSSAELLQRLEGAGILPKKGLISNQIQTPATLISETFKGITPDKQQGQDQQTLQSLIAQGNIRVIPNVLGMFLSTLASTMVKNYQEQGILPFGIGCAPGKSNCFGGSNNPIDYSGQGFTGGRTVAQQFFQSFLETPQLGEDNQYDVIGDLNNCDGNGLYNCRADSGLVQAIQEGTSGSSITIAEALKRGLLHGEWKLIPPSRVADNADRNFCQHNYCYSNIQVLRQLRILPLGFEIAVKNSNPDHPWTLSQVVEGFDTPQSCNYIRDPNTLAVTGVTYDQVNKPFCRLINPNWVIKLPQVRCANKAYVAVPLTDGVADRQQDCVDVQNCVAYNSDGTCRNFGYCTQEKNTWNFAADSCQAQFATCKSYQNAAGQEVSYLYRTLDTGFCSADTVGCRAYSLSQSGGSWKTAVAPSATNNYAQTGVFFNNKLPAANTCSPNSAGCSSFLVASSTDAGASPVYLALKKAPDYLGCYGTYATTGVWPQTQAALNRINPNPECNQYAAACIPDEQSCNWYDPVFGGTRVPARFTPASVVNNTISWNDQCAAQCVGYNAYQEMPSNYSAGQPIAYITPPNKINGQTNERTCTKSEVGCSSFTNLSTTSGGLETVEYYSYLRPCVTPAQDAGKTFITYEGSINGGYQLKSYTLVADQNGGPQYFSKDPTELASLNASCSEALYRAGQANSDCRQFSDSNGAVYYRILAHTIPVSGQCSPYRLNSSELYATSLYNTPADCATHFGMWDTSNTAQPVCRLCFQNGQYDARQGACVYYGLPGGVANSAGASQVCSAAVNSCRAYKGNAGNNVKTIFTDTFEGPTTTALQSWNSGDVNLTQSSESTQISGHSLSYIGAAGSPVRAAQLRYDSSYEIDFWAKGNAQNITVTLGDVSSAAVHSFGSASVGDSWTEYRLGPVDLSNFTSTTVRITFTNPSGGKLFLDNVSLVQLDLESRLYLVKNTLTVDKLCDQDQTDNLPGQALGCMAYKRESDNASIYVTNFTSICREGAIGCTAVFDTRNNTEVGGVAYNVYLRTGKGTIGSDNYECTLVPGRTGCYVDVIKNHTADEIANALGDGAITTSTVYIPPDTDSKNPIYLVANQAATCSTADIGCMLAGAQVDTPAGTTFVTTTIKNNPGDDSYSSMLCQQEAVGCDAYSVNGSQAYFKDPTVTGQKICVYQNTITPKFCSNNLTRQCGKNSDCGNNGVCQAGIQMKGWVWQNVGVCAGNNNEQCLTDRDCALPGDTCVNIGTQGCYPGYIKNGNEYDMFSYGDQGQYQGFVAACPPEQNMCTEYVDHNDGDKAYYLIQNSKISAGDCSGMINQNTGCALFEQTDNPNKYWSTASLYAQSAKLNQSVPAVADADATKNDANVIIKVQRDRMCSEWLQCRSSHSVYDEKTNKWKEICDLIGRCDQAQDVNGTSNTVDGCAHWVSEPENPYANVPFDASMYVNRDITWKGVEFDGYTLLNVYPVDELSMVNAGTAVATAQGWRLAKPISCGRSDDTCPSGPNSDVCTGSARVCGRAGTGVCVGGQCVTNIDGSNGILTNTPGAICRGYPEKDSPFPNTMKLSPATNGSAQAYNNAHFCSESMSATDNSNVSGACECSYTKVGYGDVYTKYWNYSSPNSINPLMLPSTVASGTPVTETAAADPAGICQGGSRDGKACNQDSDCFRIDANNRPIFDPNHQPVIDGSCQKKKKETKYIGWKGVCLEEDLSRTINGESDQHPCLTWYPVQTLSGSSDLANEHPEAGYMVNTASTNICLKTNAFKRPNPFTTCVGDDQGRGSDCDDSRCRWGDAPASCGPGYIPVRGYCNVRGCESSDDLAAQDGCSVTCVPNNSYYLDSTTQQLVACTNLQAEANTTGDHAALDAIYAKAINCITQYAIPSTNNYTQFAAYPDHLGKYFLGCEVAASTINTNEDVPNVVAWTNRLWQRSAYGTVSNDAKLRYFYQTPNVPFGATNDVATIANAWPRLLGIPYCIQAGADYYLPTLVPGTTDRFQCQPNDEFVASTTPDSRGFENISFRINERSVVALPNHNKRVVLEDIVGNGGTDFVSNTVGQLFAKVAGSAWQFRFTGGTVSPSSNYSPIDPNSNPFKIDVRERGPNNAGVGNPPTILALGTCFTVDNCYEGQKDAISVNDVSSGVVNITNANGLVTVKFYGYADADHMPVRNVTVDWDDGTVGSYPGYYQNHRGYKAGLCDTGQQKCGAPTVDSRNLSCNTDADCASGNDSDGKLCVDGLCSYLAVDTNAVSCRRNADCSATSQCVAETSASDFGHIAGRTCDSHYFVYRHVYSCPAGQTCSFVPKVQLEDNWGWCPGTCAGANSPGGTGCFDGSTLSPSVENECTYVSAYVPFQGSVVVSQ